MFSRSSSREVVGRSLRSFDSREKSELILVVS
jgi:hypothetical protein